LAALHVLELRRLLARGVEDRLPLLPPVLEPDFDAARAELKLGRQLATERLHAGV